MTRLAWLPLLAVLVLGASCKRTRADATPEGSPSASGASSSAGQVVAPNPYANLVGDPERGRRLVEKYECTRCHEGTGLAPAVYEKHCIQCHVDIWTDKFTEKYKAPADKLAQWKKTVGIYLNAPNLEKAGDRYTKEGIIAFLMRPKKLRRNMVSSMPRLPLTEQEAADIAAFLTQGAAEPAADPGGDVEKGRAVLESKACGTCHVFSGVPKLALEPNLAAAQTQDAKDAIELAPDLRYSRERWVASRMVAWLLDPAAVKPSTKMPNFKLTPEEAKDAAAYILRTSLSPDPFKPMPKRLPVLERKVDFDEVDAKVLHRTCRHCHTNPEIARGDGGPGMTGGFGFIPRKLDLSSYEGVAKGLLDAQGQRISVFAPMKDGTPRLVAALVARQKEEAGQIDPEIRGMPLGLPALSAEEVQLVESWIAQGRPQ
jgi:cytochrome c2